MAGKADLVDKIADLTGLPKTRVAMVYDHVFESIGEALKDGDKVRFRVEEIGGDYTIVRIEPAK